MSRESQQEGRHGPGEVTKGLNIETQSPGRERETDTQRMNTLMGKVSWRGGGLLKPQSPSAVTHLLHQGHTPSSFPKSSTNWDQAIKHMGLWVLFFHKQLHSTSWPP